MAPPHRRLRRQHAVLHHETSAPALPRGQCIHALRVFGCAGSTALTVSAIEWAVDPNNDSDLSDRLDVINMSLCSNFRLARLDQRHCGRQRSAHGRDRRGFGGQCWRHLHHQRISRIRATGDRDRSHLRRLRPRVGSATKCARAVLPAFTTLVRAPGQQHHRASRALRVAARPAISSSDRCPSDGAGPLTTDGCSPLTNAAAVAGNICLIDRGTCGSVSHANARDAGAIGVIISPTSAGNAGNMGGTFIPAGDGRSLPTATTSRRTSPPQTRPS